MKNNQIPGKDAMKNDRTSYEDEAAHLADISRKLEAAFKKAEEPVAKLDQEYRDTRRYMMDYRGEIDPHEMFQNELLLKQTDQTGAFSVKVLDHLARMRDTPYFARIDFCPGDKKNTAIYYIGKFTFKHENELLVYDWRVPVSSMFYDYEVGPASYEAPSGRIEGRLTGKWQYKIKNGVMEYALETSAHVQDDILQKELSTKYSEIISPMLFRSWVRNPSMSWALLILRISSWKG